MREVFEKTSLTVEEACNAISHFAAYLPPITPADIVLVKLNPSLSWFEKFFIIRKMKKQMKYQRFIEELETNEDIQEPESRIDKWRNKYGL